MLAFVAGAIAGAAVALLFAPATGEETRDFLNQRARRHDVAEQVGAIVLDRLERADRPPRLHAHARVLDGEVEDPGGGAHHLRTTSERAQPERRRACPDFHRRPRAVAARHRLAPAARAEVCERAFGGRRRVAERDLVPQRALQPLLRGGEVTFGLVLRRREPEFELREGRLHEGRR